MSSTAPDHYAVLGIPRDADADQIKKAYRKAALKWHPDKNPSNKAEAESKFKEIAEAYDILSDPAKRLQFDSAGSSFAPGAPEPEMSSADLFAAFAVFQSFFGGRDPFADLEGLFAGLDGGRGFSFTFASGGGPAPKRRSSPSPTPKPRSSSPAAARGRQASPGPRGSCTSCSSAFMAGQPIFQHPDEESGRLCKSCITKLLGEQPVQCSMCEEPFKQDDKFYRSKVDDKKCICLGCMEAVRAARSKRPKECSECKAAFESDTPIFGSSASSGCFLCKACANAKNAKLRPRCANCDKTFEEGQSAYQKDDKLLCQGCAEAEAKKAAMAARPKSCSRCNAEFTEDSKIFSSGSEGKEFLCQACVEAESAKYVCHGCKERITKDDGAVVSLGERLYHAACVKCFMCSERITSDCALRPEGPACKKCCAEVSEQVKELTDLCKKGKMSEAKKLYDALKNKGVTLPDLFEESGPDAKKAEGVGSTRSPRSRASCSECKTPFADSEAIYGCAEEGKFICKKCAEPLLAKQPKHCSLCSEEFSPGKQVFRSGDTYACSSCVEAARARSAARPKHCSECQEPFAADSPIFGSEAQSKRYLCRTCAAAENAKVPNCDACGKPASGPCGRVGDKLYHAACFKCSMCSSSVADKFAESPFGILCTNCCETAALQLKQIQEKLKEGDRDGAASLLETLQREAHMTSDSATITPAEPPASSEQVAEMPSGQRACQGCDCATEDQGSHSAVGFFCVDCDSELRSLTERLQSGSCEERCSELDILPDVLSKEACMQLLGSRFDEAMFFILQDPSTSCIPKASLLALASGAGGSGGEAWRKRAQRWQQRSEMPATETAVPAVPAVPEEVQLTWDPKYCGHAKAEAKDISTYDFSPEGNKVVRSNRETEVIKVIRSAEPLPRGKVSSLCVEVSLEGAGAEFGQWLGDMDIGISTIQEQKRRSRLGSDNPTCKTEFALSSMSQEFIDMQGIQAHCSHRKLHQGDKVTVVVDLRNATDQDESEPPVFPMPVQVGPGKTDGSVAFKVNDVIVFETSIPIPSRPGRKERKGDKKKRKGAASSASGWQYHVVAAVRQQGVSLQFS